MDVRNNGDHCSYMLEFPLYGSYNNILMISDEKVPATIFCFNLPQKAFKKTGKRQSLCIILDGKTKIIHLKMLEIT